MAKKQNTNNTQEIILGAEGDRKARLKLTAVSIAVAAVLIGVGCLFVPLGYLFGNDGFGGLLRRFAMLILLLATTAAAYDGLRIAMIKLKDFGLTEFKKPWFFLAGSKKALKNGEYALLSLAPAAIIFAILTVLLIALPKRCFWMVYIMQVLNLAITVLPIYVMLLASGMKKNGGKCYIEDAGQNITVTAKKR